MMTHQSEVLSNVAVLSGRSEFSSALRNLELRTEARAAFPIWPDQILIVAKKTLWELDQEKYGFDENHLRTFYEQQGVSSERIYQSHLTQKTALETAEAIFPEARIISRSEIEAAILEKPAAVIALGGDNHAQWVSHWLTEDIPLIGVNSDPENSFGALLQYNVSDLKKLRADLLSAKYEFSAYSRLKVTLNGVALPLALSEIFIGDKYRMNISRYFLEVIGQEAKPEEHKDSGIIISTGAGSTGWFRSAVRAHYHFSPTFDPNSAAAAYCCTESFNDQGDAFGFGVIDAGSQLKITSRFNRSGVISIDADEHSNFDFPRGSVAIVEVDSKPFWIIRDTISH